jgi:Putative transposase
MTLAATEFLRRFFLHVLPKGFVRIRHFGFLANRFLAARVKLCRQLLANAPLPPAPSQAPQTDAAIWHCPHCGTVMIVIQRFTSEGPLSRCSSFDSSWNYAPSRTPDVHPARPRGSVLAAYSSLRLEVHAISPSSPPPPPHHPDDDCFELLCPFPYPRNAQLQRKSIQSP